MALRYKILAHQFAGILPGSAGAPDKRTYHVVPEYRINLTSQWVYEGGTGIEVVQRPQGNAAQIAAIPAIVIAGNTLAELKAAMTERTNTIQARLIGNAPTIPAALLNQETDVDP